MVMKPVTLVLAALVGFPGVLSGSLFDFVSNSTSDPTIGWKDTGLRVQGANWNGTILNFTSGTWLTPDDFTPGSSGHVWSHHLVIIVPHELEFSDSATFFVTGGSNTDPAPTAASEDLVIASDIAVRTRALCAVLFQAPNAPMTFVADPAQQRRGEDALLSFTWRQHELHLDRPELNAIFPMVRAALGGAKAMVQWARANVAAAQGALSAPLPRIVLSGASKRGWTAWLSAGVSAALARTGVDTTSQDDDMPVVAGIAPIVMDLLNISHNLRHVYRSLGGWSFAMADYIEQNLTATLGSAANTAMWSVLDPQTYTKNLTMPKLVVDMTGDEFFLLDDDAAWWDSRHGNGTSASLPALPGETKRLMVPNAEHSCLTGLPQLTRGIAAFVLSIQRRAPRPVLRWTTHRGGAGAGAFGRGATIVAAADVQPTRVILRHASSAALSGAGGATRRDFRLLRDNSTDHPCAPGLADKIFKGSCFNSVLWAGEAIERIPCGAAHRNLWSGVAMPTYCYNASMPAPLRGWRGFFIEFQFNNTSEQVRTNVDDPDQQYTTQVAIVPDTLPFADCVETGGNACHGQLV
eukprot:g1145.t1